MGKLGVWGRGKREEGEGEMRERKWGKVYSTFQTIKMREKKRMKKVGGFKCFLQT